MFSEFVSQNILLVGAFVVVANLWLWSLVQSNVKGVASVSALSLPSLQRNGKSIIVDVSDEAIFAKSHIPGAINVAIADINEKNSSLTKHKSNTVVIACPSGSSSNKAARLLRNLGFEKIHVLNGGMASWTKENLPTEST